MKKIFGFSLYISACVLAATFSSVSAEVLQPLLETSSPCTDIRPDAVFKTHSIGNLSSAVMNLGFWGDPWENIASMEWPAGSGSNYLWCGDAWTSCYGNITPDDSTDKWVSCSEFNDWELQPSEGYPMEYLFPGPLAPEQTQYGVDDWDTEKNDNPYGLEIWVENYTWDTPGYDSFMATEMIFMHHSNQGNPGTPLDAFVAGIKGDCDVATADPTNCYLDDHVFYDGHAIWCNDPEATFEYVFDGLISASTQDYYTYQQNPDNPLPSGDPDNIWYYYNYVGTDGIPDNDVDQNGVSDHFTILAKIVGSDTLYREDPESGVILFSEGMPCSHYSHTVSDTTYLVVPRNLSYMWDSDSPGSAEDDSGEPLLSPPCNGFIGWRLLDFWIVKADKSIERPIDVNGYPIPISHTYWNWEDIPGSDTEKYNYIWGHNPDANGQYSGPTYMLDWVGNPNAPEAIVPQNPGPFPFVYDSPLALSYPAFEYRFLISFGPVELDDGDSLHVVGGWVVGRGLDGLRMNADLLLDAYYRESIWGEGLGIETGNHIVSTSITIFPNPFREQSSVEFTLQAPCHVNLSIYDISGRLIEDVIDSELPEGNHSCTIGRNHIPGGVYFLRFQAGNEVETGRFVVLK
ncbi:MAG: T9SS type A sorting domain-containing protein [Candidatus Aegiribacteria sp.]|nr:T9SS type A sorting domain-containing protein [Candidatus Aegiribacteria sp.]